MTKMTFDGRTLDILKNFSTINQSISIKPGKRIATLSPGKKVMATANIEQMIESPFAIYELTKFFGALSLFKEPSITIDKHFMTISDDTRRLKYMFAEAEDIVTPPEKPITLPSVDVSFTLTEKTLKDVLKAAGVLGMPEIAIEGDGKKVYIATCDASKNTNESYSEDVGDFTGGEKPFRMIMKVENLKLFPGDYEVKISFKKIAQFTGKDVEYFIAVEDKSTSTK
jgi:hypothetical protein